MNIGINPQVRFGNNDNPPKPKGDKAPEAGSESLTDMIGRYATTAQDGFYGAIETLDKKAADVADTVNEKAGKAAGQLEGGLQLVQLAVIEPLKEKAAVGLEVVKAAAGGAMDKANALAEQAKKLIKGE